MRRPWIAGLIIIALAGCSDDSDGDDASTGNDGKLRDPSADMIADAATPEHDGPAVLGCDYVLVLDSEILIFETSEGPVFPFEDLGTTLDVLRETADDELLGLVEIADETETPADTADAVNAIQGWCEDEGLL